jgi:beta-glucosidase
MEEYKTYPFWNPDLPLLERLQDLVSRLTLEEKISLMPTRQAEVKRLGIKQYNVGGEAAHGVVAKYNDVTPIGPSTVFPQPFGLGCTWNPTLMRQIGSVIGDEARGYYKKTNGRFGLTLWAPTVDMERDPRWGRTEESYGEDPHLTGRLTTELVKGMQGEDPFYIKMVASLKHFYANNNEKDRVKSSSSIDPRNKREYYLKAFEPAIVEGGAYSMMTAYNEINGTPAIQHPDVKNIVKGEWGLRGFIVCDGGDLNQTVNDHHYYAIYAEAVAGAIKGGIDCLTDDAELVKMSIREALEQGLLDESDLDQALKNVFGVRIKLGQFDPDERNPYSSIPESIICHPEHKKLALEAARESIVLLKNETNTLPLNKEKVNKVSVIGPLGDVVYRDWYTGTLPYKVTLLDGIKNKLPNKEVTFELGSDLIKLQHAVSQNYIRLNQERDHSLAAMADEAHAETFVRTDWGWGSQTLKATSNNKFVTVTEGKEIAAKADQVWGWFVKELFDLKPKNDGSSIMTAWNGELIRPQSEHQDHFHVKNNQDQTDEDKLNLITIEDGIKAAVKAAKASDVAIVCLGNHPLINGKEEIDRLDLTLPPAQERLIQEVYKANPNTILVIIGSYPYAIPWAKEHLPAIVYTAHGGQEVGNSIADVLFGDYQPAGRLNMTWYQSIEQLPDIMDYDIIKGKRTYQYFDGEVLYPFGYGLTYSDFKYSNLQLNSRKFNQNETIVIRVDLTNNGLIESDEVVQVYIKANHSRVIRPNKQLRGFKRLHLQPDETQSVEFNIEAKDLAIWDVTREKYCVESGLYTVMIGKSSQEIVLEETIEIFGEIVPPRNLMQLTKAENYDDYYGVRLGECEEGGTCIIDIDDGDWLRFDEVDFSKPITGFEARVTSETGESRIEIRLDHLNGKLLGTCDVPNTGGSQAWKTQSCTISGEEGIHTVYLKFQGDFKLKTILFKS